MSPPAKHRQPQFQCLEQRRLLAADFAMSMSDIAPADDGASAVKAATVASVADTVPLDQKAVTADFQVEQFDRLSAEAVDRLFQTVGAETLAADHGVGLDGKPVNYDTIDGVTTNHRPVGGNVGDDGFGPQGYQGTLDGANAQDNNSNQTHDIPLAKDTTATEKAMRGYKEGGLNVAGKTQYQAEHACVSQDPKAYQKTDDSGGATDGSNAKTPSGSLLDISPNHGKKKSDNSTGGSTPAPTEKQDDKTDGGTTDDDTTDDTETDGGEPAAGTPDESPDAGSPDYGEGYADPNDPIMQLAKGFTDAYFWHNFDANQSGNVTPDPNSDGNAQVEFNPQDHKTWVDGVTMTMPTEVPDLPGSGDSGDIDPVDEH